MYLSDDYWRKNGVREKTEIRFMAATPVIFPPSTFFNVHLTEQAHSKGITPNYSHQLFKVDKDNRVAYFKNIASEDGEEVALEFDFLHIVPPQKSHDFIAQSPLAHESGWLDVDIHTLQHNTYPNVFGLGDAANLPTAKTAAATFGQAPVVVHNVLKMLGM